MPDICIPGSLVSLPQELFEMITSRLPDLKDLSALSKTSKVIRAAIIPLIYKKISMVWTGTWIDAVFTSRKHPRIDLLIRSLIERPDYVDLIRKINLGATGHRSEGYNVKPNLEFASPLTLESKSRVREVLLRCGIANEDRLSLAVEENDAHGIGAFLLLLCHKVKIINFGIDFILGNPFLTDVLRCAVLGKSSTGESAFQNLRYLSLGCAWENDWRAPLLHVTRPESVPSIHSYLLLFYLPNLIAIQMNLPDRELINKQQSNFSWPIPLAPSCSLLQELRLPASTIPPSSLDEILKCTPNLITLEYGCVQENGTIDAEAISVSLHKIRKTLKELKIKARAWDGTISSTGFCYLKDFPVLEFLAIDTFILVGRDPNTAPAMADLLPANLITLRFNEDVWPDSDTTWYQPRLSRFLASFIVDQRYKRVTPRLENIQLTQDGAYWDILGIFRGEGNPTRSHTPEKWGFEGR